ncbi:actin-interacting aip3 [Trichoderma arundinaceum]|uniref:Actin-interacting aip3 n=1 Tax=Trichoderma arundinaceum TaxID=490622 RepID=A0A395NEB4_TRIAR|nr:actin-interacting aip3 [Trichoderma arundinaceum]
MQPQASAAQRAYSQRRSPGADPGPPPNVSVRAISPGIPPGHAQRASNVSVRSAPSSSGSRRTNREGSSGSGSGSNMPLSQIEKSVTHLLVATKQLLETLTQWSRGQATDAQVSDVYVRLGYEFNMACRAFTAINVDTSDLGNVPDLLRSILEACLSQEASAESLEKYLPRIRDIIINLLHGLKRKQQRLRQKQGRDRDSSAVPERTTSVSTIGSGSSGLTSMLEDTLESHRPTSYRPGSGPLQNGGSSPTRRFTADRDQSRGSVASEMSSASSNALQSMPVMPPYPTDDSSLPSGPPSSDLNIDSFPPPPPPPPDKTSSALAALQKGGDLERRASRRYSQYQISKHLGGSGNVVPMLPSQTGPTPNRGRKEARESLRAVQSRESVRHSRTASQLKAGAAFDNSPVRVPSRVAEETLTGQPSVTVESPAVQTPDDKYAPSATLSGPLIDSNPFMNETPRPESKKEQKTKLDETPTSGPHPAESKPNEPYFQVSPPPTPTKDLTLFLQYKSKVKKIVLPEGRDELSIGRLQLAFIEKFSWNTQQNGADLPEIYIQDPVSGVRHELEDLGDIKDRTVLVLNVEPLDEVKRHIDEGMFALTKIVREVKQNVDDQAITLQRVSDRQQETAKEMAQIVLEQAQQAPARAADGSKTLLGAGRKLNSGQIGEIQSLRRDLAVLRQTYSTFQSEIQSSMSTIRNKAANVKAVAAKAAIPGMAGDGGYAYVSNGRKQLNADSDRLVAKVDDLQDLVEDLRKDVVHRGVRPLPRQLEVVAKDVTALSKELKAMEDYMSKEKPIWTKIWEKELEDVCQGRDELRLMEDLLIDLRDDLEKASETFALVEQATKEQMKDSGTGASAGNARTFSKGLNNLGNSLDQNAAKEDMLGEVRALQPNHQDRLEAIERAEKLRQKELKNRSDNALHREIHNFVAEGKLKKSGGFEEVERARLAKDEKIRREVWERMNGYVAGEDDEEEEEEEEEEEGEEEEGEEVVEEEIDGGGTGSQPASPKKSEPAHES